MKIYNQNEINEISNVILNDGVVSVPTDTVFGICTKITSKKGYDKIIKIKNRPRNKPLPIMCANKEQIDNIGIITNTANVLIDTFLPGPMTIILNLNKYNKWNFDNNNVDTIAIRIATSKFLKDLILRVGEPIYLTSANRSGEDPCKNIKEIEEKLPNLDGIVEGDVSFGKASTIVDCTQNKKIEILRDGPITKEQVLRII